MEVRHTSQKTLKLPRKRSMATKKAKDKAVKRVEKAVRKAVKKGVTNKLVEQTVEDALEKGAAKSKKTTPAQKVSKAAKKTESPAD
jgi:hypothetical protein